MDQPPNTTILYRLYQHRTSVWVWIGCGAVALLLGSGMLWALLALGMKMKYAGSSNLVLAAAGAPIAWLIWLIRDRNKAADIAHEKSRNEIESAKARNEHSRIIHQSAEHATQVFDNIQLAACGENEKLQAVAIRQLRSFIFGKAEGPLPKEAKDRFIEPALAIILTVLDDRDWERRRLHKLNEELKRQPTAEELMLRRSPIFGAIEDIIRDPGFKFDLEGWNLSNLNLSDLKWSGRRLFGAKCFFTRFINADLTGARFGRADLRHAFLSDANLAGADLGGAQFGGAFVDGTSIDIKWKKDIEASDPPVKGNPIYIRGDEGEDDESRTGAKQF